jgi:hypothetical protein
MKLVIAGGCYLESCVHPYWFETLGSGLRAALAVSSESDLEIDFHTPLFSGFEAAVLSRIKRKSIHLSPQYHGDLIEFKYWHPLASPRLNRKFPQIKHPSIKISDETILRFGMVESEAVVHGNRVTYDPQSPYHPVFFEENGSTAKSLSYVLNKTEILELTKASDFREGARLLLERNAEVVVVKNGAEGAFVFEKSKIDRYIPFFKTEIVFTIGSGDVFSAFYSYYWGCLQLAAPDAAIRASRAAAWHAHCQGALPIQSKKMMEDDWHQGACSSPTHINEAKVYLAAPFGNLGQQWLAEECRNALNDLGMQVFSPWHELGRSPTPEKSPEYGKKDLEAIDQCNAVFAVCYGMRPGTMVEIGYARGKGIPVIVLADPSQKEDLTMLYGSDCLIKHDLVSASYWTAWTFYK